MSWIILLAALKLPNASLTEDVATRHQNLISQASVAVGFNLNEVLIRSLNCGAFCGMRTVASFKRLMLA